MRPRKAPGQLLNVLLAAVVLSAVSCHAEPPDGGAGEASSLSRLAEALSDAGDAIARLWEAVVPPEAAAVESGPGEDPGTAQPGEGEASAPLEREHLIDLSARLQQLVAVQRVGAMSEIDRYLERPTERNWQRVRSTLGAILVDVEELLEDFEGERGEFVLERAYGDLLTTLRTRAGLVRGLIEIPPPATAEELEDLQRVQQEYGVLVSNLHDLTFKLNDYLERTESRGGDPGQGEHLE